jgi:hypothetical protein
MALRQIIAAVIAFALPPSAQAAMTLNRAPVRLAFNIASLSQGAGTMLTTGGRLVVTVHSRRLEAKLVDPAADRDADSALRPRLPGYALMGDVYPLGTGLRVSAGVREDDNRRLLRGTAMGSAMIRDVDPAGRMAPGTAESTRQYAPVMTVGYSEQVAEGLAIGADVGMLFHGSRMGGSSIVRLPIETAGGAVNRRQKLIQMSAGYRF